MKPPPPPELPRQEHRDAPAANAAVLLLTQYRWPLTLLGLAGIAAAAALLAWNRSQDTVRDAIGQTAETANTLSKRVEAIAEKFRSGSITETFIASLPKIESGGSGRLELAALSTTETFRSEDNRRIWWDAVSLGTTVTEISVPVTYRYHLRLEEAWTLEVSNQTCIVIAPPIHPTLPPGIDTGEMVKSSQNGWARFNAGAQLKTLEKSLTAKLTQYAGEAERIALIRESARKTVAAFVRNWLLQEDQWREDRFCHVKVRFADEPAFEPEDQTVALQQPESATAR